MSGGVSTLLAVVVAVLTNLVTSGWSWWLGSPFLVLVGAWIVLEVVLKAAAERAARLDARAEVLLPLVPPSPSEAGPLDMLVPARRVMRFQGRKAEGDELTRWCLGEGHPVMIVEGRAGVGKSRLALEFGRSLPDGWTAGRLAPGAGAIAVARIRACGDPALIVIDDADIQPDLPALLDSTAEHDADVPVRLLLVTRNAVATKTILAPAVADHARWLTDGPSIMLSPHGGRADRQRWYAEAVGRFSRKLELPSVEPSDDIDLGGSMLELLIRALMTALTRRPARDVPIDQLMAELFVHEIAWWDSSARSPGWAVADISAETRRRAVLALALRGAADEEAAARALRCLPELRDARRERLHNLARWVEHLYPAARGGALIEPDLVGDWFVTDQLTRDPGLADALLGGDLDAAEVEQATAVLTRAVAMFPGALPLLVRIWGSGDAAIAGGVRSAATYATIEIDEQLADHLADRRPSASTLDVLARSLPPNVLPRTHVVIASHQADHLSAAEVVDRVRVAEAYGVQAAYLHLLAEHERACAADSSAVELYRSLLGTQADSREALVTALLNQASGQLAIRADEDALATVSEAIGMAGELAGTHQVLSAVAHLLHAQILSRLEQDAAAFDAVERAISIARSATPDDAERRKCLAEALGTLSDFLTRRGRHRDAGKATTELVGLCRALAEENPAYLPDLARALGTQGLQLNVLGEHRRAAATTEETVEIFRRLVSMDNPTLWSALAAALTNLGNQLRSFDSRRALAVTSEALDIYGELGEDDPSYRPLIASTLDKIGNHLAQRMDFRAAMTRTRKATELYRSLVEDYPIFRTEFVGSMVHLGARHREIGEYERSREVLLEAIDLGCELPGTDPAVKITLAAGWGNLVATECVLGNHDAERPACVERLRLHRELGAIDPAYAAGYQQTLAEIRARYARHGWEEDVLRLSL